MCENLMSFFFQSFIDESESGGSTKLSLSPTIKLSTPTSAADSPERKVAAKRKEQPDVTESQAKRKSSEFKSLFFNT